MGMVDRSGRIATGALLILVLSTMALAAPPNTPNASPPTATAATARDALPARIEFNRDIRPILSDQCFTCHGPDSAKRATELRFDRENSAKKKLDSGAIAIVPGKPDQSELLTRILSHDPDQQMPPKGALRRPTPRQIAILKRWIEQGAVWEKHWSFVPPRPAPLPAVTNPQWPRTGLDHFILARLEREGLAPSNPATRETWIRRVTLDLTGLPPTVEEVDAFLADRSPLAFEKVVDRLLASPRYGERMALEWLDAARYADTNGYQADNTRPMWPWRDWLIRALNSNQPFDQFTLEMIAGDLLASSTSTKPDEEQRALQQRIASGFNRNHMLNGEGGRIPEESRVEYVVDRVETTSTVWLGLTFGCARCHDHKYDPISQREFYGMYAYFNNIDETGSVDRRSGNAAPVMDLPTADESRQIRELKSKIAQLEKQRQVLEQKALTELPAWEKSVDVSKLDKKLADIMKLPGKKRSAAQRTIVQQHFLTTRLELKPVVAELESSKKKLENVQKSVMQVMVMKERAEPRQTFLLDRGLYDQPREKIAPHLLKELADASQKETSVAPRLTLARWLVDRHNPLTPRVTVNRHWQMFFGTGLVKTTEDFGLQGELPTHPELLDWLALEFIGPSDGHGWDIKKLHRQIVLSATYRQSSATSPLLQERDPENRLLARGPRFRLTSHALRDQALAVSGLLVEQVGGPPVRPYQPPGIWEDFSYGKIKYVQDHGTSLYRRTLYTFWRRSVGPTMMFDTPNRQVCVVRQGRTNTPLHSLILFNETTYAEAARCFAERILKQGGSTTADRLTWAFRTALGRRPTSEELSVLVRGAERLRAEYRDNKPEAIEVISAGEAPRDTTLDPVEHATYTGLASLILNLDETLTKE